MGIHATALQALGTADEATLTKSAAGVLSVKTGNGANQAIILDGAGKIPALNGSQLTNMLRSTPDLKLSTTAILASHDAETQTTSATYVLLKTMTITSSNFIAGSTNISVDVWKNSPGNANYIKIAINDVDGADFGTVVDNSYTTVSQTRTVSPGDVIKLYGKIAGGTAEKVKNFRILGTLEYVFTQAITTTNT